MGILSTFDLSRKEKLLKDEIEKHGNSNVFLLQKSKVFYVLQVVFPFIATFAGLLVGLIIRISAIVPEHNNIFNRGYLVLLAIVLFSVSLPLLKKHLDYHMDFLIVTPDYIINNDQEGLFQRDIVSLNMKTIKSVSVKKAGIFNSLFNEGQVEILCEGDNSGKLTIDYVTGPERIKNKINRLLSQSINSNLA